MSEVQEIVDYDWMVSLHGDRLHHVTLPEDADEDTICFGVETLTAACGRPLRGARIPGIFTRMGAMRCDGCCRALGLPTGKGSPKNDDECRRLLGWEPSPAVVGAARHARKGGGE
jgi:hypothetical protein